MLVKDVEDMESLTKHVELIVKNWKFQMKIEKQRREVTWFMMIWLNLPHVLGCR